MLSAGSSSRDVRLGREAVRGAYRGNDSTGGSLGRLSVMCTQLGGSASGSGSRGARATLAEHFQRTRSSTESGRG